MSTAPRCSPRSSARDVADLNLAPKLHDVDDVYARLLTLHDGRTLEESFRIAARLNLLLINHIGDRTVIEAACALAGLPATAILTRVGPTPAPRGSPSAP